MAVGLFRADMMVVFRAIAVHVCCNCVDISEALEYLDFDVVIDLMLKVLLASW